MNKWKIAFIVAIVLLIITNLFWLFNSLDMGITSTYQDITVDNQNKTISALGALIVKGSKDYNQKDILHLLRQADPKAFIIEEDNKISYDGVNFKFENGTLVSVSQYE